MKEQFAYLWNIVEHWPYGVRVMWAYLLATILVATLLDIFRPGFLMPDDDPKDDHGLGGQYPPWNKEKDR
ncbi:MAG TPA: hypothetical protein VKT73_15060 [Xanthobacteraceae bacterium]|nr:hypothetical protein [Xanthobacteraceae bacterium]